MSLESSEIVAIVTDGSLVHFAIGFAGKPKKLFDGVDINDDTRKKRLVFKELGSQGSNTHVKQTKVVPVDLNHARY